MQREQRSGKKERQSWDENAPPFSDPCWSKSDFLRLASPFPMRFSTAWRGFKVLQAERRE